MTGQPMQQPEVTPAPSRRAEPSSKLLIDEFLPRYDFAVVHPRVSGSRPRSATGRPAASTCCVIGSYGRCWASGR
jgi:hypothetical protein